MKHGLRSVAAASLAVVLVAGAAQAQGPGGFRGRGPGGRGQLGLMLPLGQLDLTDAQRQQIRQLLERHRMELDSEITALLTPEQQGRLEQLRRERQARIERRRQP